MKKLLLLTTAVLTNIFIVVRAALPAKACTGRSVITISDATPQIRYFITKNNDGTFGYNVFINAILYIQQSVIPAIEQQKQINSSKKEINQLRQQLEQVQKMVERLVKIK